MKLDDYLERAINETKPITEIKELRVDRQKKVMKALDDLFYSKEAEKAGDWLDEIGWKEKKLSKIIKELESLSKNIKPEFGKQPRLGKLIADLKTVKKSAGTLSDVLDDIYLNLQKVTDIWKD